MTQRPCRACGGTLYGKPLVSMPGMPAAAQHLPDLASLARDEAVNLHICQCACCGLIQTDNEPVPYFRDVIRAASVSPEMAAFRQTQFAGFVSRHGLAGDKIVEIGCGRGEYLSIMSRLGVRAVGLEHDPDAVAACRAAGLEAHEGFLEDSNSVIPSGPFDAFVVLSVLEHIPNIRGFMAGIAHNLHENALGMVEVPNFDMMLKKRLFAEFMTDHLYYFTADSLTSFLACNGFETMECSAVWHDYILSAVVRKRPRSDLAIAPASLELLKLNVQAFLTDMESNGKRTAIWGAGHQAFTVMALCNLAGRIAYVVDSAPFKQGKFTPATHIPIVAPEMLKKEPVDAVIVMAGSYSDEIAKSLRADAQGPGSIAVLNEEKIVTV
jgi:SAM-dependent methyltransferase